MRWSAASSSRSRSVCPSRVITGCSEPELRRQLDKLKAFLDTRTGQLEFEFEESIAKGLSSTREYRRQQKEREQREIRRKHDDYKTWITETMQTEDTPSIRLFAVFGNFDPAP